MKVLQLHDYYTYIHAYISSAHHQILGYFLQFQMVLHASPDLQDLLLIPHRLHPVAPQAEISITNKY
jgi:hypothetical protein